MYSDALTAAAEQLAGPDLMARIDTAAAHLGPYLTDAQAWPVLRRHLALLAIDGHDPIEALHQAAATGLGDAHDPAAVLDRRLPTPTGSTAADRGPLHWLPAIPDVLTTDPTWATYLAQRAELVSELADQIRGTARTWTPPPPLPGRGPCSTATATCSPKSPSSAPPTTSRPRTPASPGPNSTPTARRSSNKPSTPASMPL